MQVYFEQAVFVSTNNRPDNIRINFVDRYLFVSDTYHLLDSKDTATERRLLLRAERNEEFDYSTKEMKIVSVELPIPA